MGAPSDASPSVGDAVKQSQTGHLPIGTVEGILKKAPEDIVEETIDIPEWECSVKLKSFTAGESAAIKEASLSLEGEKTDVAWGEMEIQQFKMAVVEPSFTEEQVRQLHLTSGRGFKRIIDWSDAQSNINKEELRKMREDFRGSTESN